MNPFIDTVLEPAGWWMLDCWLRWAVLIAMVAAWICLARPGHAGLRYLVCLAVLVAGILLPVLPRWGPGWKVASAQRHPDPLSDLKRPTDNDLGIEATPGLQSQSVTHDPVTEIPADVKTEQGVGSTVANKSSEPDIPLASPPQPQPPLESLGTRRTMILCLACIWFLTMACFLVRWIGGWLLLQRLRREAVLVEGRPARVFAACQAELGLRRRVVLAAHPRVSSPVTLGLFGPTILVPPSWSGLGEEVERASLLHELAHLARYDDCLAPLLEMVRAVCFLHPLVHWLLARLERERELLCDETAIRRGIQPRDYVQMLVAFAQQRGRLLPTAFAGHSYPLRIGGRRTVRSRINHLLEDNMKRNISPLPARTAIVLGMTILGVAVSLGSLRVRAIANEEPALSSAPAPATDSAPGGAKADAPFRIEPYQVLKIQAANTIPNQKIDGFYLVEADGKVALGPGYGKVRLGGLTLDEADAVITDLLRTMLKDPSASVSLAGWMIRWQDLPTRKAPYRLKKYDIVNISALNWLPSVPIDGPYLVNPDGKIDLGPRRGKIRVEELTLDEAAELITDRLRLFAKDPQVVVSPGGWENHWYNLIKEGGELPPKYRLTTTPSTTPGSGSLEERPPSNREGPVPQPAAGGTGHAKQSLRYGGKTLDEWRTEIKTELKPEVRIEGIKALSAFGINGYGPEVIETILEVTRGYDIGLGDQDEKVVLTGAEAAARIGSAILPRMIQALKDRNRNTRRFAVEVLNQIQSANEPILAALLDASRDDDSDIRRRAFLVLIGRGGNAKSTIPKLVSFLNDNDGDIRRMAYNQLAGLRAEAKPAVPALIDVVKKEKGESQNSALMVLRYIGPDASEAVPTLAKALKVEKDIAIRFLVLEALLYIGPTVPGVMPALLEGTKDSNFEMGTKLINHLGANQDSRAIPALVELLKHGDPKHQLQIVNVLAKFGPTAKDAARSIRELMNVAGDPATIEICESALRRIEK
jgi:protein involved in polysaccharide export with SLBB domain/beta-lactamase regulating signal transducer with metallopeptidase domain/HEAT repeat protein